MTDYPDAVITSTGKLWGKLTGSVNIYIPLTEPGAWQQKTLEELVALIGKVYYVSMGDVVDIKPRFEESEWVQVLRKDLMPTEHPAVNMQVIRFDADLQAYELRVLVPKDRVWPAE
jgi:hypothetical protein